MAATKTPSRRYFTDVARQAALEARLRKREMPVDPTRAQMFVVRGTQDARLFTWEIRRFGGVLLQNSDARFETVMAAEAAGREALSAFVARP